MMYPSTTPWSPYRPAPVTSEEGPAPTQQQGLWPGRYVQITGIVVIAITAIAIIAAILGPVLATQVSPQTAPNGWNKAYSSNLQNTSDWTGDGSCYNGANGLDVTGISGYSGLCTYVPSTTNDLISQGFQLNVGLAAESTLQYALSPVIQISDSTGSTGFYVAFDDAGNYLICPDLGNCSSSIGSTSEAVQDSTVAWHTDSYVANTIAIRYQPDTNGNNILTVFVNGEEVRSVPITATITSGLAISIGTDAGGEALYTSATLYTAGG